MIHGYKKNKRVKTEQQLKEEEQLSNKVNEKLGEFFAIPRYEYNAQQIPKYLEFIALLMQIVSDIPTVFNFRRELIDKSIEGQGAQQTAKMLGGEIKLTTKLIQSDPKSYTIWSYRQWLVRTLFAINPDVIKAEKQLTKMLLMKDEKNFHVWNYRNWLNSIQSFIDQELAFTSEKIKSNPFNFSPYHFRTKFLHQKYTAQLAGELTEEQRKDIVTYGMPKQQLLAEFQTVKTAIFLNPNEQAPWSYYNWLLGQLVPAFIVRTVQNQGKGQFFTNMKVSNFDRLTEGEQISLKGSSGQLLSDTWSFDAQTIKIGSNLDKQCEVRLQSTGRLFLGKDLNSKWIDETFKSIFRQELTFLDEVIQSEQETKCRFAYLQKTSIYKLILQCGTTTEEFNQVTKAGLESLKAIEQQPKAKKYIQKQVEYWNKLCKGQLTHLEQSLKSKYD